MKMNRLLFVLCFTSVSLFSQTSFVSDVNKAVKSKSLAEAQKLCSQEFWEAQYIENGKTYFSGFITSEFVFTAFKETNESGLRIISSKFKGKTASDTGTAFFYLSKATNNQWLIGGINSSDETYNMYLDKSVKAHFHIKKLPQHPDLQYIGSHIEKEHLMGNYKLSLPMLDTTGMDKQLYTELSQLKNVRLVSSHFSDEHGKGVIVLKHTTPEGEKEHHIHLQQIDGQPQSWRMYDSNKYLPHLNLFFR